MKETQNGYIIESTGREFYANGYIGAMKSKFGGVDIAQGYDGYINSETEDGDDDELTPIEKIELANYMIEVWTLFKNSYLPL